MNNPRVAELLDFAREEGFNLPMAPALIVWFEERNWIVDLYTGLATRPLCEEEEQRAGTPTPSGKAISHLLTPSAREDEAIDRRAAYLAGYAESIGDTAGYGPDAIIPDFCPPPCDDIAAYDAYVKMFNREWATRNHVTWWSRTAGE